MDENQKKENKSELTDIPGLPFTIKRTASDNGTGGVLVREMFPNFSIILKDNIRINISGIARKDIKNDDLFATVEKGLKKRPHPDISCVGPALNRFYQEYTVMRNNRLFNLLRAANNRKIGFIFYETAENFVGKYNKEENVIQYNCQQYQPWNVKASYYDNIQNVTAHELGHMIMSQDIKPAIDEINQSITEIFDSNIFSEKAYVKSYTNKMHQGIHVDLSTTMAELLAEAQNAQKQARAVQEKKRILQEKMRFVEENVGDFVVKSDFGKIWSQIVINDAFLFSAQLERIRLESKMELGCDEAYGKYIAHHYRTVMSGNSYKNDDNAQRAEMFCRVLGFLGGQPNGVNSLKKDHPHKLGMEMILKLSETSSIGDMLAYEGIKKKLGDFQFSADLKKKLQQFDSLRQAKNNHTAEDFNTLALIQKDVYQLFQSDYHKIMQQVNKIITHLPDREKMAYRAFDAESILKSHELFLQEQKTENNNSATANNVRAKKGHSSRD